jgi:hypothetical protein
MSAGSSRRASKSAIDDDLTHDNKDRSDRGKPDKSKRSDALARLRGAREGNKRSDQYEVWSVLWNLSD